MRSSYFATVFAGLAVLVASLGSAPRRCGAAEASNEEAPFTLVVMDPLALQLSCPCVKGYAQRDYSKLAERLETSLKRRVKLVFNESLTVALKDQTAGKVDLVIGKCSVVEFDAKKNHVSIARIAMLTDKEGGATQTGLIVVPTNDPAKAVSDLKGYRIIFGPRECDEKHGAALSLLKAHGVDAPVEIETSPACSDGACLILEAGPNVRGAAVISSYAKPLLEGCGTIKKGALRVVGQTDPTPFVGAYAAGASPDLRQRVADALISATQDSLVRIAMETRGGFVPVVAEARDSVKKK